MPKDKMYADFPAVNKKLIELEYYFLRLSM